MASNRPFPPAVVAGVDLLGDLEVAVRTGQSGYALLALAGLALVVPLPVLLALPQIRKLVRAGYGQAEIVEGINLDLDDQARKLGAKRKGGKLAKVLRRVTAVAWTVAILGLAVAFFWSNVPQDLILVTGVGGAVTGLAAGLLKVFVDWYRTLLHNDRWLEFWASHLGAWTVKLMGIGPRDRSLAPHPEPAALPAPATFPRLAEVLERSDSCIRRGQDRLDAVTGERASAARPATAEELEGVQAVAAKLVTLRAWRDRLQSVDVASADPGSLTRDLEAVWALCNVIDALIEAQEGLVE
ncbi:MAG: hypothetical protein HYV20_13800 [Gemmatimonadetes bacterium]|nr:hypothetical protein [Gemmatimonadota bacterium]